MRYKLDDPVLLAIADIVDDLGRGIMNQADHEAWHELCSEILESNGISDADFTLWCSDRVAALPDHGSDF